MKKVINVLLIMVSLLVFSVPPGFTAEKQKIEVWHRWTGIHEKLFTQIVDKFKVTNPNIDVQVEVIPGQYINLTQKLLARLAAGQTPPDVVFSGYNFLGYMATEFGAVPLDKLGIVNPKQFVNGTLKTGQINGKQYGLPFGISSAVVYTNPELFAKAGVAESDIKTWAGLAKAAKAISSLPNKKGIYISNVDTFVLQAMVESAGGNMMKDGKATFNSKAGSNALVTWRDLYKDGSIPRITYAEAQTAFVSGQIGMMVTSIMNLGSFSKQANFPLHALPFPHFGIKPVRLSSGGTAAMLFSRTADRKKAGAEFMRFLTTKESATIWAESGYLSAIKGIEPISANQAVAYSQLVNCVAWVNWPGSNSLEIEKVILNWRDKMLYGEVDIKSGMGDAEKAVNELIVSGK